MEIIKTLLGQRDFKSRQEIAQYIVNSKHFDTTKEQPEQAKTLLFFDTQRQRTWLVATPFRLYCILDDVRKPDPHINWSMSREELFSGGSLSIEIAARDKTERTGLLDFRPKHQNWLYTKSLFFTQSVVESVKQFIVEAMQH